MTSVLQAERDAVIPAHAGPLNVQAIRREHFETWATAQGPAPARALLALGR